MVTKAERIAMAREVACDAAVVSGAGLTSYGAYSIYEPAGFIVGGILLAAIGIVVATK